MTDEALPHSTLREGVDYLVDLYAVAKIPPETATADIGRLVNARLVEYHPDRVQGLAPEFIARSERMSKLLNRAKDVLGSDARRAEYDTLLAQWDGPISEDGEPIITLERAFRNSMVGKTPQEVEAELAKHEKYIMTASGYSPDRLAFLEELVAEANGEPSDRLRAQYEQALLAEDAVLALAESQRRQVLGVADISEIQYKVGIGYTTHTARAIETARTELLANMHREAIGGVAARLAILAGEAPSAETSVVSASGVTIALPAYFKPQAQKVQELAERREDILVRRLHNFQPTYPEAEQQQEAQENLAVGIVNDGITWLHITFNRQTGRPSGDQMDPAIEALLAANNIAEVISQGYNVLTIPVLENLEMEDLLGVALAKHVQKYGIEGIKRQKLAD